MSTRTANPWTRRLWAVEMRSRSSCINGMLIGESWHTQAPPLYPGQPSHPLLFRTRRAARDWCALKELESRRHSPDWKFRPVRVETRVERCGR